MLLLYCTKILKYKFFVYCKSLIIKSEGLFHYFFDCVVYHLINHEKSILGLFLSRFGQVLIREATHIYTKFQSYYSTYEGGIALESQASFLETHNTMKMQ